MSLNKEKIALVHDHLNQMGGAERVLLEFHKIFLESPIYTLFYDKSKDFLFNNCRIKTSYIQNIPLSDKFFKWFLFSMPSTWESFDFSDYSIILSSTSALAKGIIKPKNALHFCYCHTPTRYLWSDMYEYVESLKMPKLIKKFLIFKLKKLKKWDFLAAQKVDYFIANSKFIANRIQKYYQKESKVIYPPVDVEKCYANSKREDFYLIVSRLRPYKKVGLAIQAFNQLKLPLKIIGGGEHRKYLESISKENIEFLGEVSDKVKYEYLSKAKAFIHPQEEDFGISAVEAMASGCPVIAFGSGGALETIRDKETGLFFEEQNWESIVEAVLDFSELNFDSDSIKSYANKFSNERFREEIKGYIEDKIQQRNNDN